jgi:hypothetical protein
MFTVVNEDVAGHAPEVGIMFFVSHKGGEPLAPSLRVASNFEAEVWEAAKAESGRVVNRYVGPLRDRNNDILLYSREFPAPTIDRKLVVRVRWVRGTTMTCRRVSEYRPTLWVSDPAVNVQAYVDNGFAVGRRACSQLPRQVSYSKLGPSPRPLDVVQEHASTTFAVRAATTKDLVGVEIGAVKRLVREGDGSSRPVAAAAAARGGAIPCLHETAMANLKALTHTVWALQGIGSYHLELTTEPGAPCIVVPAEVPDVSSIVRCSNRNKTKIAFLVDGGTAGRPFGLYGCAFLHVFQDRGAAAPAFGRVLKMVYPFSWKGGLRIHPRTEAVAQAVKHTLEACVDGDIVDTCWRESTVWTGDAAVASRTLMHLSDNIEVVLHVATLIAATYNPDLGMVAAIAPVPAHTALYIPSYHLLFCLLVAEVIRKCKSRWCIDVLPEAAAVLRSSMKFWRENYINSAGLVDVPASDRRVWHFVDWSAGLASRNNAEGASGPSPTCNAVLNCLYVQMVRSLGGAEEASVIGGVNTRVLREVFALPSGAFKFLGSDDQGSVHATANAILAKVYATRKDTAFALQDLLQVWGPACAVHPKNYAHAGPTAFYGGFVCDALLEVQEDLGEEALWKFILDHYGKMARKHRTLIEKKVDDASLAHSWSVGVGRHVWVGTE